MRKITLLILVLFISGCAATGAAFKPIEKSSSDESVIYIYRLSDSYQMFATPPVYINGKHKIDLSNGGYVWERVKPGEHEISVKRDMMRNGYGSNHSITVNTEAGKETYIKLEFGAMSLSVTGMPSYPISGNASSTLVTVPEEQAKIEISECRYDKPAKLESADKIAVLKKYKKRK